MLFRIYQPKSIKSLSWAASPPPLFDQPAIRSFTSFPKSSCNLLKSSGGQENPPDRSSPGGAGAPTGTTLALLLGHSLGDLLAADLEEVVGAGSDLRAPDPAGCGANAAVCAPRQVSAELQAGVVKLFPTASLDKAPNASDERENQKRITPLRPLLFSL